MDFKPTLIIGVGGTGCSIAQDVYSNAKDAGLLDKGQLAVLGFDTDDNDVRALKGLGDRQKVRFSSAHRIYNILEEHPDLEDSWFLERRSLTHDILNMTLIDGAGQVRTLTRLALHAACRRNEVISDLRRVISDLAAVNNRRQFEGVLNIFLIGSLAGATGCGSFLQIALAARQIARESAVEHPQVRGLFLLPDIFVRAAGLPRDQEANVLTNAYAALRELNAVTLATLGRIPLGDANFEYMPGYFLRDGEVPFEAVTFIDYENTKGQSLGRNIDHYKSMASRAAYTLLFTPIGQRVDFR